MTPGALDLRGDEALGKPVGCSGSRVQAPAGPVPGRLHAGSPPRLSLPCLHLTCPRPVGPVFHSDLMCSPPFGPSSAPLAGRVVRTRVPRSSAFTVLWEAEGRRPLRPHGAGVGGGGSGQVILPRLRGS